MINKGYALAMAFFVIPFVSVCAKAEASVTFESLPDEKIYNDFVVGPGKIDMELAPGESGTFEISVSNRLGTDKTFSISEEDFTGSDDPKKTVVLLGSDRGPYSLRDYLSIGTSSVVIPHGMKSRISVKVAVPRDAQPGGLYGSVIVGTISKNDNASDTSGISPTNPIVTRVGTLIFVRVKGDVNENGYLSDFKLSGGKSVAFNSDRIVFELLFKNEGNVHLSPKGTIKIKNMLGTTVGALEVDPWFAMPNSLRFREVEWKPAFLFGRYVAEASIYRGYGEGSDQKVISFWIIPWKVVAGILVGLVLILLVIGKVKGKRSSGAKMVVLVASIIIMAGTVNAETMSSTNYKLESDSINFGGGRSSSGSYIIEDTLGEIATGISSSTNYTMKAGYQQYQVSSISVTPASDVVMSPSIGGLTGGVANGQTSFTVTTDNPAGYMATISVNNSPALISSTDSFADYAPAGAVPDFAFTSDPDSSSFAFTPESGDLADQYKDSGAVCGVGGNDTADACWDGLSVVAKTILNRNSPNQPVGTVSTVKFRAVSGSNHVQEDGVYTATTTITVLSL